MRVSVVIPIYNTEKYLRQCVNSVLRQTYKNIEVVLVDDGSTDDSPVICDEYESMRANIVCVHQKNGGLSAARNTGIRNATGDYILFLDSDDYWDDPCLVEKLVNETKNGEVDIVNYRYKHFYEDKNKMIDYLPSYVTNIDSIRREDVLEILLGKGLFLASACNKLIRTSLMKEHELYFREGIISEDVDWCARVMLACKTMSYNNSDAYIYRQRTGSITHTVRYENVKQVHDNVIYCMEIGDKLHKEEPIYDLYYTYVAYQYGVFLVMNNYAKDARVKELRRSMKKYRWLLHYKSNKKVQMLYWLNKLIGYQGMNLVMKVYAMIR